jgi:hypothetical protein
MKTVIRLALVVVTLLWVVDLPKIQAVNPPPDGGYPGFNTAEGSSALKNLTSGVANAAAGWYSLFSNTEGSYNIAVGAGTLLCNIGNQSTTEGSQNTASGTAALLFNSAGSENTATGAGALLSNTTGVENTANGAFHALEQYHRLRQHRRGFLCICSRERALSKRRSRVSRRGRCDL